MHQARITSLSLLLVLFVLSVGLASAQTPTEDDPPVFALSNVTAELSEIEELALDEINVSRISVDSAHLTPNTLLNQAAAAHVEDLAARDDLLEADIYTSADGATVEDWLAEAGYPTYSDPGDYGPDVVVIFTENNIDLEQVIFNWIDDANHPSYRILSGVADEQPYSPQAPYREVGIASVYDDATGSGIMVIIFAAQPNALPITIASPLDVVLLLETQNRRDLWLHMHDENAAPQSPDSIGAVEWIYISEQAEDVTCPAGSGENGWMPFTTDYELEISEDVGEKTIHVYFCDADERMTLTTWTFNYDPEAEGPDELTIISAFWEPAEVFVILNDSGDVVDLSEIVFESDRVTYEPIFVAGILGNLRPGSCILIGIDGRGELDPPKDVECMNIAGSEYLSPGQAFWDHNGFDVDVRGADSFCTTGFTTRCFIGIPR